MCISRIKEKSSNLWRTFVFGMFLIGFGIISLIFTIYDNPFYFNKVDSLTRYTFTIIIFLGILIVIAVLLKPKSKEVDKGEAKTCQSNIETKQPSQDKAEPDTHRVVTLYFS